MSHNLSQQKSARLCSQKHAAGDACRRISCADSSTSQGFQIHLETTWLEAFQHQNKHAPHKHRFCQLHWIVPLNLCRIMYSMYVVLSDRFGLPISANWCASASSSVGGLKVPSQPIYQFGLEKIQCCEISEAAPNTEAPNTAEKKALVKQRPASKENPWIGEAAWDWDIMELPPKQPTSAHFPSIAQVDDKV